MVSDVSNDSLLKENERLNSEMHLYRSMFEKSHVAQVIINPDYKIVDMNDAFCRIVGYPRNELQGMDFRDFRNRNMVKYLFDRGQSLADALQLKSSVQAHAAWITTDNTTHIVDRNIIPFLDDRGSVKDIYIIYDEVTEIENEMAEVERLKKLSDAIVQQNPMPILLWDKNMKVISSNNAFIELTGFSKDQAEHLTISDFTYISQSGQSVADTIRTGQASKGEATIQFPNGERVVERYNIPLVDAHGDLMNVLTVYNNITEQKRAIRDILDVSREAEKGNLSARAVEANYTGDFLEIAHGFNRTLDVVVVPIREAMRLSDELAECNFSARFDENVGVSGDFLEFKNVLNHLGKRIDGAVREINRVANNYASGDFSSGVDARLHVKGDLVKLQISLDKLGVEISHSLSVINRKMQELLHEAEQASTGVSDVSHGAEMITKNAENTKLNAERSEAGITQVLHTMEDLTRTVAEVSSNAEAVATLSNKANDLARQGISFAGRAEEGMGSITTTSKEVEEIIAEIKTQMDEIGKIVVIISDLANQTNLLALNAAIEAARAGEAGKGFAVVASEVKALAQGSRKSAENIGEMITGLQKKSLDAANAMNQAGNAVKAGNAAVIDTLRIFNELTSSVEDISKKMETVAGATQTQAAAFEEITSNVNEMSGLVRQTAKDALNSSTTSEEALSVVANITKVIHEINQAIATIDKEMSKFKLKI